MGWTTWVIFGIAAGFFVVERLWPAMELPKVRAWWPRVVLVNSIQLGIVILAGYSWDLWLAQASLFRLQDSLPDLIQGGVAYFVSTVVYYGWHRLRHESRFFWRLCHQIHHSPRRLEILTSFYKHPVEITLNSILSASIVYTLLGCTVAAGAYYTLIACIAELFYHWNISTPKWIGYIIQRPESHRVHHQYRRHTNNYADLPFLDMIFGTFRNPRKFKGRCGFDPWREDKFEDQLVFRDVNGDGDSVAPLHFLPTCIGCSKRWACHESLERERKDARDRDPSEERTSHE